MSDPLFKLDITGTIPTKSNPAAQFRAGRASGQVFREDEEYEGFALTIEVSSFDEVMAIIAALGREHDA